MREERHREGEEERSLLSRARVFSLFLCFDSGSSLSPPPDPFFDDEPPRTITTLSLSLRVLLLLSSKSNLSLDV